MKKFILAGKQAVCFVAAVGVILFLCTGSAYAFRNRPGEKGGRGDYHHSSGASVIRNQNPGRDGRGDFHQSPRYVPQHRPDHRPHYRPPVHHHRPPVHHYRPPVRHHRHYSPRFHIGLGANFFWPWFGYYPAWHSGSVFAIPPVGTVFVSLPLGYSTVSVGSTVYYHNDGVYYKEVPSGYVVTEPPDLQDAPVVTPPVSGSGEQVYVTTQVLNMRSGPGFEYPVILQVEKGDSLGVNGEKEGWIYVQTADGQFGWVVKRFTTKWNG